MLSGVAAALNLIVVTSFPVEEVMVSVVFVEVAAVFLVPGKGCVSCALVLILLFTRQPLEQRERDPA